MKKIVAALFSLLAGAALAASVSVGGQTANVPTYTAYDGSAWAICRITWGGAEFIDCYDHGRGLQSAVVYDQQGEALNPTQAGRYADGRLLDAYGHVLHASTSKSLLMSSDGVTLSTRTQMAYWNTPGAALSDTLHAQVSSVRWRAHDAIAKHFIGITVPGWHSQAQFEVQTGYMPATFSRFRTYDPATGALADLSDGPGEQPLPIIFCTPDSARCMGIYVPAGLPYGGYGRWRFLGSACMTSQGPTGCVKWNAVTRVNSPAAGATYNFVTYTFVGSLSTVMAEMNWAHANP